VNSGSGEGGERVIEPVKPRIKRFIRGKHRQVGVERQPKVIEMAIVPSAPLTPPDSHPPLDDLLQQDPKSAKRKERVFQHSGSKYYWLQDGPVSLLPVENRMAKGGFSVQIKQQGRFVGRIAAGEEIACRKLLVRIFVSGADSRVVDGTGS
jgi:hypothetical protein